jgi:hypothetical protein
MKQESIEEEAKNCLKENRLPIKGDFAEGYIVGAIFGSEWQQRLRRYHYNEPWYSHPSW